MAIRLAEIFDVSTDYLLIDGAPRRRFGDPGDEFTERIAMAGQLSAADKAAISHIINGLLANTRIWAALDEAQLRRQTRPVRLVHDSTFVVQAPIHGFLPHLLGLF